MKKKLNIEAITNELSGGSAFFPGYRREGQGSPAEPPNSSPSPQREPEPATSSLSTRSVVRPNSRTPVRPNGRRIITRNSFEIYEDQMDSLRKRAMEEKLEGKLGSMSAMAREAIDEYLSKKAEN